MRGLSQHPSRRRERNQTDYGEGASPNGPRPCEAWQRPSPTPSVCSFPEPHVRPDAGKIRGTPAFIFGAGGNCMWFRRLIGNACYWVGISTAIANAHISPLELKAAVYWAVALSLTS